MKTQNMLILIVVLAIILLGALYLARPIQAPVVPATQAQQGVAAVQSVTTPGGFTLSYADPYALTTTQGQVLSQSVIPPCDAGFDYCLYRTGTQYADTNFETAGIAITERKDLPSQASCISAQPDGYSGLKPKTTSGNGYVIGMYSPIGGAGAGSSERGADYRLWFGTTCYDVRTRVAQAQFANYPAGTKIEFTAADSARVFSELQNMLNGMTINGTPVTFPSA